jgi:hypothetical protein
MAIDDNVKTLSDEINIVTAPADQEERVMEVTSVPTVNMPDFLKAQTGSGAVEDYLEHPLNFSKSKGLARVIRGLTGMLGSLDLAIIDIIVGGFEFMKEKKGNAAAI